jgi:hypothetical protein
VANVGGCCPLGPVFGQGAGVVAFGEALAVIVKDQAVVKRLGPDAARPAEMLALHDQLHQSLVNNDNKG